MNEYCTMYLLSVLKSVADVTSQVVKVCSRFK